MISTTISTTRRVAVAIVAAMTAGVWAAPAARAQDAGMKRPTSQQIQQRQAQQLQAIRRMRKMRNAYMEKFYKELGITPAQRQKLDAIQAGTERRIMSKVQAMRAMKTRPTPQQQRQMMTQVRAIAMQSQKQFMAVLTPAQRRKYARMAAEQMKKMRAMRGGAKAN